MQLTTQPQTLEAMRSRLTTYKSIICPTATDVELAVFAEMCLRLNLDPFIRQIHMIKQSAERIIYHIGIDGFRVIAQRTGRFAGSETVFCGEDGQWSEVWLKTTPPFAAKTTIWLKDAERPVVAVARWKEYNTGKSTWTQRDCGQLGKCSEALAHRKAFPMEFSGVYAPEEFNENHAPLDAEILDIIQNSDKPVSAKIRTIKRLQAGEKIDTAKVIEYFTTPIPQAISEPERIETTEETPKTETFEL